MRGERAEEWKLIGDADGRDVRRQVGLVAALVRGEGARGLGIGDERAKDVAPREREIEATVARGASDAAARGVRVRALRLRTRTAADDQRGHDAHASYDRPGTDDTHSTLPVEDSQCS